MEFEAGSIPIIVPYWRKNLINNSVSSNSNEELVTLPQSSPFFFNGSRVLHPLSQVSSFHSFPYINMG